MATQKWFKDLDGCAECGTTNLPYKALGLCVNCYARKHRQDNIEKAREYDKEYESRPEVKEKRHIQNQTEERKASVNKSAAKFRENNKELCYERTREWRLENPDKLRDYELNVHRKMNKLKRYGPDAIRLIEEKGFICQKCGSDYRIAIHHIDWDPDNNIYENFAVLCGSCHSKVHWWIPKQMRRELFNTWMILPLEETDGEVRVRNIRFPEKNLI